MLDKKHSYTTYGQLLVFAGLLNLIVRINVIQDVIISFFFITKGGSLIRGRRWYKDKTWNCFLSVFGIAYPLAKITVFYFIFKFQINTVNNTTVSPIEVVVTSSFFLLPMSIISFISAVKLNRLQKKGKY